MGGEVADGNAAGVTALTVDSAVLNIFWELASVQKAKREVRGEPARVCVCVLAPDNQPPGRTGSGEGARQRALPRAKRVRSWQARTACGACGGGAGCVRTPASRQLSADSNEPPLASRTPQKRNRRRRARRRGAPGQLLAAQADARPGVGPRGVRTSAPRVLARAAAAAAAGSGRKRTGAPRVLDTRRQPPRASGRTPGLCAGLRGRVGGAAVRKH
jgi:hypothetical protein